MKQSTGKDNQKPDFIIYNAGTDTMRGDRTTRVNEITPEDIIARDEFVFQHATQRNIPIISLFSGGYAPDCADVISASLENVINKFYKKEMAFNRRPCFLFTSDPAGTRTQDPYIKSVLRYQLSYGILFFG